MWMQRAPALSASSKGKRLVFLTGGSRGEVQPVIALAAGCKRAGFSVMVLSPVWHMELFEEFDVSVSDMSELAEDTQNAASPARGSPTSGGALAAAAGDDVEASTAALRANEIRMMYDYANDFNPDLVLGSLPARALGQVVAERRGVPYLDVHIRCLAPSAVQQSPYGEPCAVPGPVRRLLWLHFHRRLWRGFHRTQLPTIKQLLQGENAPSGGPLGWDSFDNYLLDTCHPAAAGLVCTSPVIAGLPSDASRSWAGAPQLGVAVVKRQDQLTKAYQAFGCRDVLRDFLDCRPDDQPVYFGFAPPPGAARNTGDGSPKCTDAQAKQMTCLCVEAARAVGRRAVVLSGDFGLRLEFLDGRDDLRDYAQKSVLFAGTAPHEFLLPRCAVAVHHGGVGTTACALRGGVPSVVCPSTWEEREQGRMVERLRAGVTADPAGQLSAEGLAAAVRRCLEGEEADAMRTRCQELAKELQKEDAATACAGRLDRFLQEQVATGRWEEEVKRRRAKKAAAAGALLPGWCLCGPASWLRAAWPARGQ